MSCNVSVLIPTYRRENKLLRTLNSVFRSLTLVQGRKEIIVVFMSEPSRRFKHILKGLEKKAMDQNICLKYVYSNPRNYISGAINRGVQESTCENILLMADDVILLPSTIKRLLSVLMRYRDIGIVSPICYYYSNPHKIWWAGTKIDPFTGRHLFYGRDIPIPPQEIYEVDSFTTVALIRRVIFYSKWKDNVALCFVNEKMFPIHFEETVFSFKAKALGFKVTVYKKAVAFHDITESDKLRLLHVHDPKRAYYVARNRILFHRLFTNGFTKVISLLSINLLNMYYVISILSSNTKLKTLILRKYLQGIIDGYRIVPTNPFICYQD